MNERLLPLIFITMQFLCAIPYALKGDLWMAGYWIFASGINICVVYSR